MSLHNRNSLEPWISDDLRYYDHQVEGVRRMSTMKSLLLADEMGLGKTLQTLTAFVVDIKKGLSTTMVVVCPASLKMNWQLEARKFLRGVHAVMLTGSPKKRAEQIEQFRALAGPKILIVNYEQVTSHLADLNALRFDIAVFDEAHSIKNPKAKRTVACVNLLTTRSLLLTGSPLLNHVNDLYVLLKKVLGSEIEPYYKFMHRYAVYGGYENKQIVGVKNEQELFNRLQAVMIRRKKSEVLDLPAVQYITRSVELHPKQLPLYNKVFHEMKLTVGDGESMEIGNALTKYLKCKQICGTTATVDDDEGTLGDHSYKLDAAVNDARQLLDSGERVVAFTQFLGVQEAYAKRLRGYGATETGYPIYLLNGSVSAEPDGREPDDPKKRWSRQEIVDQWAANPRAGIIIAMFQVAGVGLNMTAGRYGQFLDKLYVPDINQQAVDRMHRIGASETHPVQMLEYICKDTVEERVEKILATKKKVSGTIVEGSSWTAMILREAMKEE